MLFQAALAAEWKEPPRDDLDFMVLKTSGQDLIKCDKYEQLDFVPFDPRTKHTEGKLKGPDGNIFRITKGAPHVVMERTREALAGLPRPGLPRPLHHDSLVLSITSFPPTFLFLVRLRAPSHEPKAHRIKHPSALLCLRAKFRNAGKLRHREQADHKTMWGEQTKYKQV